MAKKAHVKYLIVASVFSIFSTLLLAAALATNNWLYGTVSSADNQKNYVNFGLIEGTYKQRYIVTLNTKIKITYLLKENVCAFSTDSDTEKDIKTLYDTYGRENFINACAWIFLIIFTSGALCFSLIGSVVAILNVLTNPTSDLVGTRSLYAWFGLANVSEICLIILWVVMLFTFFTKHTPIKDVISGGMKTEFATFGYSSYLPIVSLVLRCVATLCLYLRDKALNRPLENQPVIKVDDNIDGILF